MCRGTDAEDEGTNGAENFDAEFAVLFGKEGG